MYYWVYINLGSLRSLHANGYELFNGSQHYCMKNVYSVNFSCLLDIRSFIDSFAEKVRQIRERFGLTNKAQLTPGWSIDFI